MEFTGFLFTLLFSSCTYMFGRVHASLTVFPYRSQLFKYESFSLSCDESRKSSGWTVKARTVRGLSECGQDWGSLQESSCVINEAYSWHSGVYWCESTAGERSPAVNISITESNVILESPVALVMEGESVTLRCTTQSNSSDQQVSIFLRNRSLVSAAVTGQMIIPAVSKADEGLYMCKVTEMGASAESWLTVRDAPDAPDAPLLSVSRLICLLLVGTPYLLSTILLGLIYRDKMKAQRDEETSNSSEVQTEDVM